MEGITGFFFGFMFGLAFSSLMIYSEHTPNYLIVKNKLININNSSYKCDKSNDLKSCR